MPDVSIDNTIVQEDLSFNESVTVPSGESWDVTIVTVPDGDPISLNGLQILFPDETLEITSDIEIVLHEGDTVSTGDFEARIRGWVVSS